MQQHNQTGILGEMLTHLLDVYGFEPADLIKLTGISKQEIEQIGQHALSRPSELQLNVYQSLLYLYDRVKESEKLQESVA